MLKRIGEHLNRGQTGPTLVPDIENVRASLHLVRSFNTSVAACTPRSLAAILNICPIPLHLYRLQVNDSPRWGYSESENYLTVLSQRIACLHCLSLCGYERHSQAALRSLLGRFGR